MAHAPTGIKILGVVDEEPFHPATWSGSSRFLFESLRDRGSLCGAISAEPSAAKVIFYKMRSFYPDVSKWRFLFHINTDYFKERTNCVLKRMEELRNQFNIILQIGAWYDLTSIPEKKTISYHDGNIHAFLNSPFGYPSVSCKSIRKVFEFEKRLYEKMDVIFTMSNWLRKSFILNFNVPEEKVISIGAGINLPKIKEIRVKDYDNKRILFVGKSFNRKGGSVLLDAFRIVKKEIKSAELVIIGPSLKNMPDGVICLDFINKTSETGLELLLSHYASSSIFVLPSLYEPFGIAFAEAMAHKLPCIGSDICAMPEIIDHGENGFVVPVYDSRALADKIIAVLKDANLCKSMGDKAYEKYFKNYRWQVVSEKMTAALS
jgi:alpha-maltose-1-phosphate synthase